MRRTRFTSRIRKTRLRRYWRRSRLPRYGSRRRRIFRAAMARRPRRPEVKFIDRIVSESVQAPVSTNEYIFSPPNLPLGSDQSNRIGQEVNLRKLYGKILVTGPSSLDATGPNNDIDNYVRLIFWTPRIDYSKASDYMDSIGLLHIINHNVATVHKDLKVHVSQCYQPYLAANGTTVAGFRPPGNAPWKREIDITMMFPRKAKFAPSEIEDAADFDLEKDVMFMTVYNNFNQNTTVEWRCRLFYTDA